MSEVILAATITAAASVLCQMIMSARTQSLIAYRVDELERKVDKLFSLTEQSSRMSGDGHIPHLPHFSHSANVL